MTQIMELPKGGGEGGGGGGDAIKINADNHLLIPPNFNSKIPNDFSDDENTSLDSSVFSNDDHGNIDDDDGDDDDHISPVATEKINDKVQILIPPNSELPKPEPPPGVMILNNCEQSTTILPQTTTTSSSSSIGSLLWGKSSTFSSAITRRLSSLIDEDDDVDNKNEKYAEDNVINVTEFNLSGLQVIVNSPSNSYEQQHVYDNRRLELRGRISFFSKSNCRDCTAVRSFFRQRNLRYVEINIDVFPMRRKELMERTGSYSVPQIFFNEKLFGGLVALNSLRNSGMFEDKLKELLSKNCAETAPAVPVYGCDDEEEERTDEMADVVMILRERLPVQDRLMRMKIVKNCFSGSEVVDVIMKHYAGCDRNLAVEIGKQLAQKHFLHHVFGENEFEDGNHYYRLLEHEPFILRCFNFQGSTSDSEPNAAAIISERLTKLMSAILESYASEDRRHLNYIAISNSEEFRRYVNLVQKLHRVNIWTLSADEKLAFFLNLYNAMVIHAEIKVGHPVGVVDRRSFNSDFMYVIGGQPYSLTIVKNGILRSNRRAPYALVKSFGGGDKRLELAFPTVNPLIHFGLCNGTRSSPVVRFFTPEGVQSELRSATRDFFQKDGMEVDLSERTVYLTRIINWFDVDFGKEKDLLNWVMKYLDATKAGLLTHLLADGGPVNIVYQNYDWSSNC